MSIISEQVKELRKAAKWFEGVCFPEAVKLVDEAADTIESLSAKLSAANTRQLTKYNETERQLIEEMAEEIENLYGRGTDLTEWARDYLEDMEQLQVRHNDEWIYCGDRKNTPEKTGFYMVTKEIRETGERFTGKSRFDTEKGWNDPLNFVDIVAWQPLPLEYKGHSEEGGDSQ